ncbi:MAG: hypothetical protein Q9195_007688 [Heterodermia aff. obscurata]
MRSIGILLGIIHCVAAVSILTTVETAENCKNITFTVQATATNILVDTPLDSEFSNTATLNAYLQNLPVTVINGVPGNRSGTFDLAAVYCVPSSITSDTTTTEFQSPSDSNGDPPLQILIHGSTYTKEYWDHGAWNDANSSYSWRMAANSAGYATLAIDKLGSGASSHPDPVLDVQLPLQMETIHAVIKQIKSGKAVVPKSGTYIFVGHASGSSLGASLAQTYPDDIDALVLTGYSSGSSANTSLILAQQYEPAAISDSKRFGNLSYGYLLGNSLEARTTALYYEGHYDPTIPPNDYSSRGVQAIGERFSLGPKTVPAFQGKVLVLTGANDQVVCGSTPARQCSLVPDAVMNVNASFSSSTGFEYYIPQTGRNVNWHYKAPVTFDVTFQKLDSLLGRSSAGWRVNSDGLSEG